VRTPSLAWVSGMHTSAAAAHNAAAGPALEAGWVLGFGVDTGLLH
jgi:hypothetical protein